MIESGAMQLLAETVECSRCSRSRPIACYQEVGRRAVLCGRSFQPLRLGGFMLQAGIEEMQSVARDPCISCHAVGPRIVRLHESRTPLPEVLVPLKHRAEFSVRQA